mmetsp:Transcript_32450/g.39280  ORF Transcript_32450/g.39280 Transcript_32450/m.39280 type:complete len:525 (-) Transcript_32450:495-2069(-)|eukprot:CAMPEP_0197847922 /NCGR_PEP_ID=MMETSP1438-20131217/7487_1 /TAXON_ID=1461541 /ORGANISM="Pterosperma sp., Strain CCMP1384" /LENGTH=524 /DNA_ID=CAMNT_0043460003 /DNA_START=92 /DNA_END=1666 /DNA_ORIENTATION=+
MAGQGGQVPSWVADRESGRSDFGEDTVVPDMVKTFVAYFYRHIREKNVFEILSMYETSFAKLSERFFKASSWPSVQLIAPLVDNDHVFCLLYREMYFRHLYAKCTPTVEQRCESWDNYCSLFGVILHGNVNMQLPNLWLWEMIDEFIYQFQSFCQYRGRLSTKTAEEIELLKRCDQVWNVLGVLNYLQALIDKSGILDTLEKERTGEEVFSQNEGYDYNSSNVLRLLGYYSMVGLLRVHTLIGDYHSALKAIDPIDLDKPGMFTKTSGCYITTLYYVGFSYLQLRRYTDAIKSFNYILCYINRSKQFHQRSASYEQIVKKQEQMYALLAIAIALSGQAKLLDEVVNSNLREKYSDKMGKMVNGDEAIFDELFSFACPKFITPHPPSFEDPSHNYNQEAYRLQLKCFLNEVSSSKLIPTLRSFLKLYTTISVDKLASFLDVDGPTLRTALCNLKRVNRQRQYNGGPSALDYEWVTVTDVDFYIDDNMIHVVDNKVTRQYGDYFASNILKFERIMQDLDKAPDLVF